MLIWDGLNLHKAAGLREFAASRDWLTIYCLPPYAPDLNPVEASGLVDGCLAEPRPDCRTHLSNPATPRVQPQ
ncbi:transposase [Streptomyces sp. NPDC053782]|uniref:transposase n=1 Tax=Streptomyces sp. NPDC053782 TaxID=3155535 RepID=UPI00341E7B84